METINHLNILKMIIWIYDDEIYYTSFENLSTGKYMVEIGMEKYAQHA